VKKIFSIIIALMLVIFSVVPAFAAGINSYEQSVLSQMNTPANMNGHSVYVPASYINQAEAHFNTIDMTAQQASKINSIISQGRSFLEGTGKSSVSELTGAEKKQLLQYASAAAGVLNLTAVGGSDTSRVKVIGKDGKVILDESGNVIKTTGGQEGYPVFGVMAVIAGALVAVSFAGILVKAKKKTV
jgi:hypothetical protein